MSSSSQPTVHCTICLDRIHNPIKLPCNHAFCYGCLVNWRPNFDIFNKRTCPHCRCAIPPTREMITTINSIKSSFITIEAKLNSPGPLIIPRGSAFSYIRLLPEIKQQPEIRRALERQAQAKLDCIDQFEKRYGVKPMVLDDTACFDYLPAEMAEAVRLNQLGVIQAFLGPPPVSQRRLHAKCRSYSDDTLLHMASSYRNIPLMKLLLFLGADVNTPNLFQFTPLFHSLIDTNDDSAARLLLSWGARKVTQCSDRWEPCPHLASIAQSEGKAEISQLLRTPLGGRRCVLHHMLAQPHFNGKVGIVGQFDSEFNMYEVMMEQTGELTCVPRQMLQRCDSTPQNLRFKKSEVHALGELALLYIVDME